MEKILLPYEMSGSFFPFLTCLKNIWLPNLDPHEELNFRLLFLLPAQAEKRSALVFLSPHFKANGLNVKFK